MPATLRALRPAVGRARSRLRRVALIATVASVCLECGYGFGNCDFQRMRQTAVAFAQALQANDSARMRQLSWGEVRDSVGAIAREAPLAYVQFATPTPELVTLSGGGIYGGGVAFLVRSTRLDSCHGGIRLDLELFGKDPRIVSVRLVPPIDSATSDRCPSASPSAMRPRPGRHVG